MAIYNSITNDLWNEDGISSGVLPLNKHVPVHKSLHDTLVIIREKVQFSYTIVIINGLTFGRQSTRYNIYIKYRNMINLLLNL